MDTECDAPVVVSKSNQKARRIVALLGRTDTGKTSFYNLMTGDDQPLGNHIISQTQECVEKIGLDNRFHYIDTIGFKDSQRERESHGNLVDYFVSFSEGLDIIFYIIRHQTFASDDRELIDQIFNTVLTLEAYNNTCLLITNCSDLDLENVNDEGHAHRKLLLNQMRVNPHLKYLLDKINNRVVFVDIPKEKANAKAKTQRETSRRLALDFIDHFKPEHFNSENLTRIARIMKQSEETKEQNAILINANKAVTVLYDRAQQKYRDDMEKIHKAANDLKEQLTYGRAHEFGSWTPVTNIVVKIYDHKKKPDIKQCMTEIIETSRPLQTDT